MIELGWGLLGGFIAAAVEEVGRGAVRSAVGQQGGGAASAASSVHAVGGAGGAESTEARWSRRGWRHVEIDRQTVTGEPEERVRKTKAGGHAPCTGP
jgi:hypothetical protein